MWHLALGSHCKVSELLKVLAETVEPALELRPHRFQMCLGTLELGLQSLEGATGGDEALLLCEEGLVLDYHLWDPIFVN